MGVVYEIGADDAIRAVGGDWDAFAHDNGTPTLTAAAVIGRPIWDFVGGLSVRDVYAQLVRRARTGRSLSFRFRCDAPWERRYMRMRMGPAPEGGVRFETDLLTVDGWPGASPAVRQRRTPELLTMCGWCGRAEIDQRWEEPEVAVDRLGVFLGTHTPSISHGICPSCAATFESTLQAL